jgi:uncharacterized protein
VHNTNILHTISPGIKDNTTYRQTFFYNQVSTRNSVKSIDGYDFKVNDNYLFSVGGKYNEPLDEASFSAADRIEVGEGQKIPLWLFGFLY